jgi:hypothetical protein
LIGRSFTSRSITLVPMRAELRSTVCTPPVTVTVSVTPAGRSSRSIVSSWAGSSCNPVYSVGAKSGAVTRSVYTDGRRPVAA